MPDLNQLTHYFGELAGVLILLLVILAIFGKMLGVQGERLMGSMFRGIGSLFSAILTPIVSALWSILVQIAGHLAALIGRIITSIWDAIKYGGNQSGQQGTANSNRISVSSVQNPISQISPASADAAQTINISPAVAQPQPINPVENRPQPNPGTYISPYDQPPDIIIVHQPREDD